jgi:hypothetical protein
MRDFNPTEHQTYKDGDNTVKVHIQDDMNGLCWQLEVNSSKSEVYSYYPGVLVHQGYAYCTPYWEGVLPIEVPFKIGPALKPV